MELIDYITLAVLSVVSAYLLYLLLAPIPTPILNNNLTEEE